MSIEPSLRTNLFLNFTTRTSVLTFDLSCHWYPHFTHARNHCSTTLIPCDSSATSTPPLFAPTNLIHQPLQISSQLPFNLQQNGQPRHIKICLQTSPQRPQFLNDHPRHCPKSNHHPKRSLPPLRLHKNRQPRNRHKTPNRQPSSLQSRSHSLSHSHT